MAVRRLLPYFAGGRPGQLESSVPEMARFATPIKNLYLGGASAWPGPTVSGGGRAVAQVLFEDMDIDFDAAINS